MSKCFIVLGMHRSATSLVAGGLDGFDVNMGNDLMARSPHNRKGHFENMDFVKLNRQILKDAGGSWDNPPPIEKIVALQGKYKDMIKRTIERNKAELWGFKDPRTTLTIRLYEPHLENTHYIACFRDPKEVAKSLCRRDGIPIKKGLALANEYNDRLLNFLT